MLKAKFGDNPLHVYHNDIIPEVFSDWISLGRQNLLKAHMEGYIFGTFEFCNQLYYRTYTKMLKLLFSRSKISSSVKCVFHEVTSMLGTVKKNFFKMT